MYVPEHLSISKRTGERILNGRLTISGYNSLTPPIQSINAMPK